METLYQITGKFENLMNEATAGELSPGEFEKAGEELALELQNKSKNIIGYVKNEEAMIEAIATEIKRLQEMKKARENRVATFKEYVKNNMERLELKNVDTEIGSIKLVKGKGSVEIIDPEKVPNEFKKVVTTVSIDKNQIMSHFKETGEVPEGTNIKPESNYLRMG